MSLLFWASTTSSTEGKRDFRQRDEGRGEREKARGEVCGLFSKKERVGKEAETTLISLCAIAAKLLPLPSLAQGRALQC